MSHVRANNVMQSCSAPGTGNFTSLSSLTGRDTFSARLASGDSFEYFAIGVDVSGTPNGGYENGVGTWDGSQITRQTVLQSSNSDALVNFAGNTYVMIATAAVWTNQNYATGYCNARAMQMP